MMAHADVSSSSSGGDSAHSPVGADAAIHPPVTTASAQASIQRAQATPLGAAASGSTDALVALAKLDNMAQQLPAARFPGQDPGVRSKQSR